METRKLTVLLEAIRLGTFRKAALELGYTPPALTTMMDSLESEFGFPLLNRSRNGVTFSEYGKVLEPYIHDLIMAETALRNKAAELSGTYALRIGAISSVAVSWFPQIIHNYQLKYPEIDVSMLIGAESQSEWIDSGKIDFGVMDCVHATGYEQMPLKDDLFYAVVPASAPYPPDQPVPLDDILNHHPVLFPTAKYSTIVTALKGKKVKRRIKVATSDGTTLMFMVEKGMGIAFVSKLYLPICPKALRMLPTDPPISRTLCICAKSFDALSPFAKDFIAFTKEYALHNT